MAKATEKQNKPLLDKLGVKRDSRVAVLGITEARFLAQLARRAADVARDRLEKGTDIIFLAAENKGALGRLACLRTCIRKNGAIWVVFPKGKEHIRQSDVMAAGKAAGLVDVKVVSFSLAHTALKLVIPVAQRTKT